MAYKFDENKYKKIFNSMHGSGSFDSGLNDAYNTGKKKAQAEIALSQYKARKKEEEKQRKAEEQRQQAKPQNDWAKDVVESFNREQKEKGDAKMSESSLKASKPHKGAGSVGESYWASKGIPKSSSGGNSSPTPKVKKNPFVNQYSREDLKEALSILKKTPKTDTFDTITAKQALLESFSKQFNNLPSAGGDKGPNISAYDKSSKWADKYWNPDKKYTPKGTVRDGKGNLQSKDYDETMEERKLTHIPLTKSENKSGPGFFDRLKKSELGRSMKAAEDFFNPFDSVSAKDAVNSFLKKGPSKTTQEIARGANRVFDSASLGALSNLDKRVNDREPYYNSQRSFGEGGGTDMLTSGLGYLVPGAGAVKAARGVGLGLRAGSTGGKKLAQIAGEGAITGAGIGAAEVGIREALNGGETDFRDNLKHIGIGAAAGAVADPLLHGIASIVKGRFTPKNPIPKEELLGLPGPTQNETLSLPQPQKRLPEPSFDRLRRDGLGFGFSSKNTPQSRPLGPLETPIDPMNRGQSYWQGRYENFAKTVNSTYDTNRLTKESLEDLWSQFAKYDEPVKLEQVVDLAYPKGFGAEPKVNTAPKIEQLPFAKSTPKKIETLPLTKGNLSESIRPLNNKGPSLESGGKLARLKPNKEVAAAVEKPKAEEQRLTKAMQDIKDIKQIQVGTTDLYRLADRLPGPQRNHIVSSLDKAKKSNVDHQEKLTNDLYDTVVKKLGIKKGSADSALVQDFGEKTLVKRYLRKRNIDPKKLSEEELSKINLQQLKKVHPDKWQRIVEADKYFRNQYNQLIEQVNVVRKQLYPNNPDKLVPKRGDYYHHFNELEGFEGIKNLFDTPANIDPHLEGVSAYTKPKTKFQGFMQKRGIGPYKSDAVGGFLKYLQAASHSINIDPVIPVLRTTANELADATVETKNANKIIEALQDHANDLAGKTNPYDRLLQKIIGRKGIRITSSANSRIKSNMIVGNLGSALGQIGNVPLGIGKAKQYSVPGLKDTLIQAAAHLLPGGKIAKDAPINQSDFLKERFSDKLYRRFDQKLVQQPKNLAIWMLETADRSGTSFIWNSMYNKGVSKGVSNAVKYADDETRKIVAGRGVGEVPLAQKSKTMQIFAPFTLEVGNQWRVLKDMVDEKDAAGLMTFLIASYSLNDMIEQVRGSSISFDPVGAVKEGYEKADGNKPLGALASLTGEVVGNIPGGNLLTNMVNTDRKIPMTDLQIKEVFGERNPNRFGSGLTLGKMIEDPAYIASPFGAAQFRKAQKGLEALQKDGVYKGDGGFVPFSGPQSELMYPLKKGSLENLKLPLFGPSSTSAARDYYDNDRRPLSEKQTAEYEKFNAIGNGEIAYNKLMTERKERGLKKLISDLKKNKELSDAEKRKKLQQFMESMKK